MACENRWSIFIQIVKFSLIGLMSSILNYATFLFLLHFSISYLIAMTVGFFTGTIIGYYANSLWTFNQRLNPITSMLFLLVYSFSLFLGLISIYILVEFAFVEPSVANILTIIITAVTNFVGSKYFVFSKS